MKRSWSETQALAERAALGLAVPYAQAARFGGAAARHLAEGRDAAALQAVLEGPEPLVQMSAAIERAIEAASIGQSGIELDDEPRSLLISFLQSLPCAARIEPLENGLRTTVHLDQAQSLPRPARLEVPEDLWTRFEELAARTYVPDSDGSRINGAGAGTGLMELD